MDEEQSQIASFSLSSGVKTAIPADLSDEIKAEYGHWLRRTIEAVPSDLSYRTKVTPNASNLGCEETSLTIRATRETFYAGVAWRPSYASLTVYGVNDNHVRDY